MRVCRDCPTPVAGVMRQRCPACAVARDRRLRRVRYSLDRERELALKRKHYRENRERIRARQNANWRSRTERSERERAFRRVKNRIYARVYRERLRQKTEKARAKQVVDAQRRRDRRKRENLERVHCRMRPSTSQSAA